MAIRLSVHHISAFVLLAAYGGFSVAADFTVVDGQTETTTRNLNDGETGIVESGGAINTFGGTHGIDADDSFTIRNDGTITTTGNNGDGIDGEDFGTATNNGSISTTGNNSDGIDVNDSSTVINTGTITTTGIGASGIEADDNSIIFNSGSIFTSGPFSNGIDADNSNTINNSGDITTTGFDADAIDADDGNTIVNTGTINTSGGDADGIDVNDNNTVTNRGVIIVTGPNAGANASAIEGDSNNTITNSGTLISTRDQAINLTAGNNTVNLMGGTVIQGGITLAAATNSFNYGNGLNSVLTFTGNLPATVNTNGMPFAINGMTIATVDTTGFAMADEIAGDITDCGHDSINYRLNGLRTASGGEKSWSFICGNHRHQDDSTVAVDAKNTLAGAVVGRDHELSSGHRLGFFAGISGSEMKVDYDAQEISANSLFAGVFGGFNGATNVDLSLLFGIADHSSDRHVTNNLVSGGLQMAGANYTGYFISPSITVSGNAPFLGRQVQPSLQLSYTGLYLDGYSETGSAANIDVESRDIHMLSARGLLTFPVELTTGRGRIVRMNSYVGLAGRLNLGSDRTNITLFNRRIAFDHGGEETSLGFIGGTEFNLVGKDGVNRITVGINGQLDTDGSMAISANIGTVIPF